MAKILIIDDESSIRRSLRNILEYEKYKVTEAEDGASALASVKEDDFDTVLCDIKMPMMDGLEVLDRILELKPETPVVMISGHGTIETAVEALKKGAYDFISKPPDMNRLLVTVRNAIDRNNLVEQNKVLERKVNKSRAEDNIIGESEPIMSVKAMIGKVAPTDARVLITGGNGSGKELVARQIHARSKRSKMPFVEVNCAAIPSELIESELFGHEKGAFTSAMKQRKGKFEQADGGTLFMDEIGDMSAGAQAKVLRALQENKIQRVGGDKDIKVDARVLAATNKDLVEEIKEGSFREDLYHRLSVILIHVPSLKERSQDIPLLTNHFLKQICKEHGIPVIQIQKEAVKALQKLPWSGNIRELRNVVERLVILCGQTITEHDVNTFGNPSGQGA